MPERFSRASVGIDVGESPEPAHAVPDADTPFRILVLGDFSGRGLRGEQAPVAGHRPRAVDCDNLDEAIASMSPFVLLPRANMLFHALDDFHPDSIYRRAEVFRKLAELRKQSPPAQAANSPEPPAALPSGRSLLESMMDAGEPAARVATDRDALADFLKRAVEPHLVPRADPRQTDWAARIDDAAGEQMRAILHHPHFQAIEAAWRSVAMLIDRLQPDTELKIYLFDATLDELMAGAGSLENCFAGSEDPWALIVGNYAFGRTSEDAARLGLFGRLASQLGAPFVAEAEPPSDTPPCPQWQNLVHSAEARWIGLAMPRFLLRLPYGKSTSPAEELDFEEMPGSVHAHYLWGNPAFFCACVLGLAFRAQGWELRAARHRQLEGLPQHIYRADGESFAKPCAEMLLTEADAEFILANGYMPLASMKDQDSVLLVRMQSIADPPAPLSGRWTARGWAS